jgi:hypothetical protein
MLVICFICFALGSVQSFHGGGVRLPSRTALAFTMKLDLAAMVPGIMQESIITTLPRDQAVAIVAELRTDETFLTANQGLIDELLVGIEGRVRTEKRTIREILGGASADKLLTFVREIDIYDAVSVKAFLSTGIVEQMIGEILYDAIFEFLKRADIVGNVANSLPLIGPIRQQITKELKRALDIVLGPQVKTFLASYSRVAVQRMIDFILKDENKSNFKKANANLIESLLGRRPIDLLPKEGEVKGLRDRVWSTLKQLTPEDTTRLIDLVYEQLGDKRVCDVLDLDLLLNASPSSRAAAQAIIDRYVP